MSTQEQERRVAEALRTYAEEVVVVTEQDVERMRGELRKRLGSHRKSWRRPGWFAPAAAVAVVVLLVGWFLVFRPFAPVPDAVAPAPEVSAAPYDQPGAPCKWVTQADAQAAPGDLAPGFMAQPVSRSWLYGVGSSNGPAWDLSCQVYVNAAMNSAGELTIQTAGFGSDSMAQLYLQEHWVRSPRPSWTSSPLVGVGDVAFYEVAPPGYGVELVVLDKARVTTMMLIGIPPHTDVSSQLVALYRMARLPG